MKVPIDVLRYILQYDGKWRIFRNRFVDIHTLAQLFRPTKVPVTGGTFYSVEVENETIRYEMLYIEGFPQEHLPVFQVWCTDKKNLLYLLRQIFFSFDRIKWTYAGELKKNRIQ